MGQGPKYEIYIDFFNLGVGLQYDGFSTFSVHIAFLRLHYDFKGKGFDYSINLGSKQIFPNEE